MAPNPQEGRRYSFWLRVVYKPFEALDEALDLHREWLSGLPKSRFAFWFNQRPRERRRAVASERWLAGGWGAPSDPHRPRKAPAP